MEFIQELGVIFILATAIGFIGRFIRIPIVVSYIVAGLIIGPNGLGLINDPHQIEEFSTLGLVFLLFLVGIELNVKKIRELGKTSILTVLGHASLTIGGGYIISKMMGFNSTTAWYIGLALIFNSAVIVVKSLSERRELDTLHGRITIGVLLIQDAIAIGMLVFLNGFSETGTITTLSIIKVILTGLLVILSAILCGEFIFPRLFKHLAKSSELLTVSTIGWAFFAALASQALGLSVEAGAFIAGVSIAGLPYTTEIISRIRTLRDFFVTIFFVSLGTMISFANSDVWWPTIILTLALLIGSPLIVAVTLLAQRYKSRVSIMTALSFSQIGEFSLLIIALAYSIGHITTTTLTIMTLVTAMSIALSSFIMVHAHFLARVLSPIFKIIEGKKVVHLKQDIELVNHVVVFGAHRIGQAVIGQLKKHKYLKERIVVVDANPGVVNQLVNDKISSIYGDMLDPDIIDAARVDRAELVISTTPEFEASVAILNRIKKNHRRKTTTYVTAKDAAEALALYEAGADYVILPHYLSGEYVGNLIEKFGSTHSRIVKRKKHIMELEHLLTAELKV